MFELALEDLCLCMLAVQVLGATFSYIASSSVCLMLPKAESVLIVQVSYLNWL